VPSGGRFRATGESYLSTIADDEFLEPCAFKSYYKPRIALQGAIINRLGRITDEPV
jgi:hypothetical protein